MSSGAGGAAAASLEGAASAQSQVGRPDYTIEIALLGDTGVGKSSILYRYSEGIFKSDLIGTAGVDHKQKNIVHLNSQVRMTIWDTAGQVKFRPLAHTYYKGAAGIVVVYDVTDQHSYENMGYWLQKIKENADPDSQIIMLGNKVDLINDIVVDQELARKLAAENNIPYYQTSAKDGKNLDNAFQVLLNTIIQTDGLQQKIQRHKETFRIGPDEGRRMMRCKRQKCCQ